LKKVLALACGLLSGGALFAIMALTFFDVGGRKLLENSIPGSLELTELLMVVVIFAALPWSRCAVNTSCSTRSTRTCRRACCGCRRRSSTC